jgi:hypothetical protein
MTAPAVRNHVLAVLQGRANQWCSGDDVATAIGWWTKETIHEALIELTGERRIHGSPNGKFYIYSRG